MKKLPSRSVRTVLSKYSGGLVAMLFAIALASLVFADVPGRLIPRGSVPNPGAQQQELPNITFPAPYNVFEFVVTCMACHGGTIDQTAGHGSNWAGSNMASAARDPVFRANQIIVNNTIKNLGAGDGAGNVCFRCHSPNGWLSGRFDPQLGGAADGSDMIQSILLSTDGEGVSCEMCHRAIGGVTQQRADLALDDPVWNMLAGIFDWPHLGNPYLDGPTAGNPYGDATLQFHDGMSYGAKYGGNTEASFSDLPLGGTYTGQTYGVYPWWYTGFIPPPPAGEPSTNPLGEVIQWNPDGSISFVFEAGVMPDPIWGAVSPEHSTRENAFVKSPEFCGACHDLTIPMLNHGMPEQRTYTEWKYSAFGRGETGLPDNRCQACHMPTMKHEYADNAPISINPDPLVSGWYPYARDRNIGGGTSFHKFAGSNRVLPMMMKVLYPEVDMEVLGAPTGHDPRIFPGMLSDRGPMFDRAQRNTEIALRDGVSVEIISGPTLKDPAANRYEVQVKVTNNTGHKLPSGYPDGRRMWLSLVARNPADSAVIYQSGYYDQTTATLFNDSTGTGLTRAQAPVIDSTSNAVMIYEKRTGSVNPDGTTYSMSLSLINKAILFDNRIPPLGFRYADYQLNGAKFWKYTGAETSAVPVEDGTRYPDNQNWDVITYTFTAPAGVTPVVRAEIHYQSHSREFMEHLKTSINALPAGDRGPRPEGPPNPMAPNYPLTLNYLSDVIDLASIRDLDNQPLSDNWGGIAYAAWMLTGKGAPFIVAAADTAVPAPPAAPTVTVTTIINPATGVTDPNVQKISWTAVPGADGYLVWVRYGADELTSDWDKLAVVQAPQTEILHEALNVAKTFAYKVQAFNGKGYGPESAALAAQTPWDLPLSPMNTKVAGVTDTTITLTWYDQADNEIGFIIERQDVPLNRADPMPNWLQVAQLGSSTPGGQFGGNTFTDGRVLPACTDPLNPPTAGCHLTANWTPLQPGRTYNYRVSAYNTSGTSVPDLAVAGTTLGRPPAPSALTATVISANQVDLSWSDNSGSELGFRVERATDPTFPPAGTTAFPVGADMVSYSDTSTAAGTTYHYRVFAYNASGDSLPSNTATAATPGLTPPAAPTGLTAIASPPQTPGQLYVDLAWSDNANNENGFYVERSTDGVNFTQIASLGPNAVVFRDETVDPKVTYSYRVAAFNAGGPSPYSNVATAVTPGEIPQAPSLLRATLITSNTVTLGWVDNANNEAGFYVERSPNGTTGWARVGTSGMNTPRFRDSGLTKKTDYWYRVQAYNADGVSEYSNVVAVRTK